MQYSGTCDLDCAKIMCRLLALFLTDDHKHIPACVCVCPNARIPSMRDCGSVALSGHRSLHLPASRGGFQEMPQVVAVQEIPPDYNRRLYKDAAHCTGALQCCQSRRSAGVLHCGCTCSSCLWQFLSDVVPVLRCGPRLAEAGHVVEQHNCTKFDASHVLFEHCLISYLSIVMCHGLLPWTFTNWAEIHSKTY